MASLNLDIDFFDHPKTKRLIGLLGRGAEVLPLRLWCYVGKYHTESGELTGYSAQEIETLAGWWGKSGDGIAALLRVKFLEEIPNGYRIYAWHEREGHLWAFKVRAKKANDVRWGKLAGDATGIPEGLHEGVPPDIPKGSSKESPYLPYGPNAPNQPANGGAGNGVGEPENGSSHHDPKREAAKAKILSARKRL